MGLEDDKAIREQSISEGYKTKSLDAMQKVLRCNCAELKYMCDTIRSRYRIGEK